MMTDQCGSLTRKHFTDLILAIGLVDLDEDERRLVEWLAGWDQPTVDALVNLIGKLKRP